MTISEYLEKTKNLPPSPLLIRALSHLIDGKTALDLGVGGGKDTKYLLENGLMVTSLDKDPAVGEVLNSLPNQDHLTFVNTTFDNFDFDHYDLINAHFSLPFNPKSSFEAVWSRVKNSLNAGGVFVGQFFGPKDSWNTPNSEMNFHKEEGVRQLLDGLDILELTEEDRDATTTLGAPKHWHIFHIIAQKPA